MPCPICSPVAQHLWASQCAVCLWLPAGDVSSARGQWGKVGGLSEINTRSVLGFASGHGVSGMLTSLGHLQRGSFMTRSTVWAMSCTALLVAGLLTACTASEPVQSLDAPSAASPRSLTPEQSGPVATITPTPLASPQQTSPSPSATSTPSPSASTPSGRQGDAGGAVVVPAPKPKKTKKPDRQPASNCDPNYSGACVPIVGWDLDCGDIGESVTVEGADIHRFDADGDGSGCESY